MVDKRTGRIQITGLSPEEKDLIRDAARLCRRTIREWAIRHASDDAAEARWAGPQQPTPQED